jgi:hypothetical protein
MCIIYKLICEGKWMNALWILTVIRKMYYIDKDRYKRLQTEVQYEIRKAGKKYMTDVICDKDNTNKLWSYIKGWVCFGLVILVGTLLSIINFISVLNDCHILSIFWWVSFWKVDPNSAISFCMLCIENDQLVSYTHILVMSMKSPVIISNKNNS